MSSRARPNIRHLGLGVSASLPALAAVSRPRPAMPCRASSSRSSCRRSAKGLRHSLGCDQQVHRHLFIQHCRRGQGARVGLQRHRRADLSHRAGGRWLLENRQRQQRQGTDIRTSAPRQPVAAVVVWGRANQQFRFVARGGNQFSIHARHTDMAVDLVWARPDNGTPFVQYLHHGTSNQHFTFDKVGGAQDRRAQCQWWW